MRPNFEFIVLSRTNVSRIFLTLLTFSVLAAPNETACVRARGTLTISLSHSTRPGNKRKRQRLSVHHFYQRYPYKSHRLFIRAIAYTKARVFAPGDAISDRQTAGWRSLSLISLVWSILSTLTAGARGSEVDSRLFP